MKEAGKVVDLRGDMALVELARTKVCQNCGVCLVSSEADKMLTEARNLVDANVGDDIYVELEPKKILFASLVAYGLPLLLMILGYLFGSLLGAQFYGPQAREAGGVFFGFVCVAGSYLIIKRIDNRISGVVEFQPVITKVIEAENEKGR